MGITPQTSLMLLVTLVGCKGREVVVLPCGNEEVRKRKLFEQSWLNKGVSELTGTKSLCCSWAGKFD